MWSCLAGVYNEYLLKNPNILDQNPKQNLEQEVDLNIQNIFMYVDSIVCNLFAVTYGRNGRADKPLIDFDMLSRNGFVVAIIITNAFCGLSTSYFIKTYVPFPRFPCRIAPNFLSAMLYFNRWPGSTRS